MGLEAGVWGDRRREVAIGEDEGREGRRHTGQELGGVGIWRRSKEGLSLESGGLGH